MRISKTLVANKHYCELCRSHSFKECVRCHRPFDHPKYFQLDREKNRCDTCQTKYINELIKRTKMSSKPIKLVFSDSDPESISSIESVSILSKKERAGDERSKKRRKKTTSDDDESYSKVRSKHHKTTSDDESFKRQRSRQQTPVKKSVKPRTSQKKTDPQVETLKSLLCEWSTDDSCMKRLLDGKRVGFVPVFL